MRRQKLMLVLLVFIVLIVWGIRNCSSGPDRVTTSPDYLNSSLDIHQRVNDLMERMSLQEKVGQMCQYVGLEHMKLAEQRIGISGLQDNDALAFYPGVSRDSVAKLIMNGAIGSVLHVVTADEANELQKLAQQSRLKIPLLVGIDAIHGNGLVEGATIYPSPISQAATFSDSLVQVASRQTALEMRANGMHWAFTPNIDLLRDPRWGRCGETFGEDPLLVGNMGVATVKGLQNENQLGANAVIACAKHLIGGGEPINGLNAAPFDVGERTIFEMYLPPFKRAIKEGKVFSIMAAHNEVSGVPCHMNSQFLSRVLREKWGFKGFYVSDWNDVKRIATWHHVAKNYKQAIQFAVDAGIDMNMHGPGFDVRVLQLVKEGKLTVRRINQACEKILTAKFRLGLFERSSVDVVMGKKRMFSKEHKKTALALARRAVVLLKNAKQILPLERKGEGRKILITGPNANNQTTLGDWVVPQPKNNIVTVVDGIKSLGRAHGYRVQYVNTGERSKEISNTAINKAVKIAQKADYVVLVLGENSFRHDWKRKTTGENVDRAALKLSGNQAELAQAMFRTRKPVILLYVSGSPIAEPDLEAKASAVLNAWEGGAFGGKAIAEVLFGKVNPSGKLPLTIPQNVGQIQSVYNHKPTAYKHHYHTTKNEVLHPFGFGLSYTKFEITAPRVSNKHLVKKTDSIVLTARIENIGKYDGAEIVQLYIRDCVSSFTRPVKELKAYKRVFLKAGSSKRLTFVIRLEQLAMYDKKYARVVESGDFELLIGTSSASESLKSQMITVDKLFVLEPPFNIENNE